MRPSVVNDLHYDNDGNDDHGGKNDDDDEGEDDSDVKIAHDIVLKPEYRNQLRRLQGFGDLKSADTEVVEIHLRARKICTW